MARTTLRTLLALLTVTTSLAAPRTTLAQEGESPQADPGKPQPSQQSELLLRTQANLLQATYSETTKEIDQLAVESERAQAALARLDKSQLDPNKIQSLLQEAKNALLNATPTNLNQPPDPAKFRVLVDKTHELRRSISDERSKWGMWPFSAYGFNRDDIRPSFIISEIYTDLRYPDEGEVSSEKWTAIFSLTDDAERAPLDYQLAVAQSVLPGLTTETIISSFTREKNAYTDAWKAIQLRIKSATEKRTQQRAEAARELPIIGQKLEALKSNQIETDKALVYAIYAMIAVLLTIFIATLFASQESQRLILEGRLLVEIIGMAFLLLTIIILGTGRKINSEVLGALIGTIGGYIFGQSVRRASRKHDDAEGAEPGETSDEAKPKTKNNSANAAETAAELITAEQTTKAIAEQVAKAIAEQTTKGTSEQVAKAIAEQTTKGTSEQVAKAIAEQTAKSTSEQVAKSTSEQVAKDTAAQTAKAIAEQVAKSTSEQTAKAIAEQTAEQTTKGTSEQTAKDTAEQVAKAIAEQVTKAIAEQVAKAIVEQTTKGTSEQVAKAIVEQTTKGTSEQVAKASSEENPPQK